MWECLCDSILRTESSHVILFTAYLISFLGGSKDEIPTPSPGELDSPGLKDNIINTINTISSPPVSSLLLCFGESISTESWGLWADFITFLAPTSQMAK